MDKKERHTQRRAERRRAKKAGLPSAETSRGHHAGQSERCAAEKKRIAEARKRRKSERCAAEKKRIAEARKRRKSV